MRFLGFGKKKGVSKPLDPKVARRIEVANALLHRATDAADNVEEFRRNPLFRRHVLALGNAVSTAVSAICFSEMRYFNDPPFYSDIWTRTEDCFADLAAFLSYQFVINEMREGDPNDTFTPELLSVAATVYPASQRAVALIDRFVSLMRDPQEMRQRCILGVFAGSSDDEARSVVFEYIVNEIVGGPPLELDVSDESKNGVMIDPAYSFWLRMWLGHLQMDLLTVYREATVGGKNVRLADYIEAADNAMSKGTAAVEKVFG